jgi:hypothetical protein
MKNKLVICGGSDSSVSKLSEFKGTSFGEIIAREMDWDLVNLSRQGCSNSCIRLQIDEAIKQSASFVIINPTVHSRIEIPVASVEYTFEESKRRGWNAHLDAFLKRKQPSVGYDKSLGLANINYENAQPYRIISEQLVCLAENEWNDRPNQVPYILTKETQNAVKQYINYMYDSEWKLQQDKWILGDGIMRLAYENIPYMVISGNCWDHDNIRHELPAIIQDKNLISKYEETIVYATSKWPHESIDPGYHTSLHGQRYLANIYLSKIMDIKS